MTRSKSEPEPSFRAFEAMGTRFECVIAGFYRDATHAERSAAASLVQDIITETHGQLSAFDRHSPIGRINRLAGMRPVQCPTEVVALLQRCIVYHADTAGAFDISAGALMHQHGFRTPNDHPQATPRWGIDTLQIDHAARTARLSEPGVSLDLGAVAKGYALDLVRDELTHIGITNALVHGGTSSIIAIGNAPGGHPWRIRLVSGDLDAPIVDLTDRSLACSVPSGRSAGSNGHIMDPRTGQPVPVSDESPQAACVIGPSAEVCEVWSTALVVDPALARRLPPEYAAYIRHASGWSTSSSATRCHQSTQGPLQHV